MRFYSIKKNQWFARNIRIDLELNTYYGKVYKRVLQLWVSRKLINSGLDKFYQKKYWCIIFGGNNLKISIWINEKFNAIGEIYLFTTSFFFQNHNIEVIHFADLYFGNKLIGIMIFYTYNMFVTCFHEFRIYKFMNVFHEIFLVFFWNNVEFFYLDKKKFHTLQLL